MCDGSLKIKCYDLNEELSPYKELKESGIFEDFKEKSYKTKYPYEPCYYVDIVRISNWTGQEYKDNDGSKLVIPLYMAKNMAKQILNIDGPTETGFKGAGIYFQEDGDFILTMGDKV